MDMELKGLEQVMKQLIRASKFCAKTDQKIKKEHKRIARNSAKRLKRKITRYDKDIYVYGSDGSIREIVPKGTYKRSISSWSPKKQKHNHVFYVGARAGHKVKDDRDAWFQLIVEQGKQFIEGGPNRNKGVLTAHVTNDSKKVRRQLIEAYRKEFKKRIK